MIFISDRCKGLDINILPNESVLKHIRIWQWNQGNTPVGHLKGDPGGTPKRPGNPPPHCHRKGRYGEHVQEDHPHPSLTLMTHPKYECWMIFVLVYHFIMNGHGWSWSQGSWMIIHWVMVWYWRCIWSLCRGLASVHSTAMDFSHLPLAVLLLCCFVKAQAHPHHCIQATSAGLLWAWTP